MKGIKLGTCQVTFEKKQEQGAWAHARPSASGEEKESWKDPWTFAGGSHAQVVHGAHCLVDKSTGQSGLLGLCTYLDRSPVPRRVRYLLVDTQTDVSLSRAPTATTMEPWDIEPELPSTSGACCSLLAATMQRVCLVCYGTTTIFCAQVRSITWWGSTT